MEVSFRLEPMPNGTPMRAKARHARENDCLEVTALENLARFLEVISGSVAR